jgi:glutaminyl-peptide cyclotransferase
MSDGTPTLRVLDPLTLREVRRIKVTADGQPVFNLNELEWVKGEILANIWQTDQIARIDPKTGQVVGWINLSGLLSAADRSGETDDVLNGIAYDAAGDRLFVTGKRWPKLFEIRLVTKADQ